MRDGPQSAGASLAAVGRPVPYPLAGVGGAGYGPSGQGAQQRDLAPTAQAAREAGDITEFGVLPALRPWMPSTVSEMP
jgi:hypothetical protein